MAGKDAYEKDQVVLGFHSRLTSASPGQHVKVLNLKFSADDTFVVIVSAWPTPSIISAQRNWASVAVYDVKTRTTRAIPPDKFEHFTVVGNGVAFGPVTAKDASKGSMVGTVLGRGRPKSNKSEPMALCFDAALQIDHTYKRGPSVNIVDLVSQKHTSRATNIAIRPPLTWSPDGQLLAAPSLQDASDVFLLNACLQGLPRTACLSGHLADVTQLAFTPDSKRVISLAKDGSGRLVNATMPNPGKLVKSFRVSTSYPASILQVSPDGRLVASAWGRQVVFWYPDTGGLNSYSLEAVRGGMDLTPLAISPDCQLLVCRSDAGLDISDAATGEYKGRLGWNQNGINFATTASFSRTGKVLAVGCFDGAVVLYNIFADPEGPVEVEPSKPRPHEMP